MNRKRCALILAWVFALLLAATPIALADPGTAVGIGSAADVPVGGSRTVDITINTDDQQGIGSAKVTLTVNTAVVEVTNVANGDLDIVDYMTVGDTTTIRAATGNSPGPIGTVTFATVTLSAQGSDGQCSDLDIEVIELYSGTAGDPQPITPSAVADGTFCITDVGPAPSPGLGSGAWAGIGIGFLLVALLIVGLIIRLKRS